MRQETCLAKMVEYVQRIEGDQPDLHVLEAEAAHHAELVGSLRARLAAMEKQHGVRTVHGCERRVIMAVYPAVTATHSVIGASIVSLAPGRDGALLAAADVHDGWALRA